MGNYIEAFCHFVWATKGRTPYITDAVEGALHDYLRHKCGELNVIVHALNGMPDHVHLACTLPATISMSECIGKLKGASSHYINSKAGLQNELQTALYWQANYGAITFARQDLPRIIHYINRQKQHHADNSLRTKLERIDDAA